MNVAKVGKCRVYRIGEDDGANRAWDSCRLGRRVEVGLLIVYSFIGTHLGAHPVVECPVVPSNSSSD